MLEKEIIKIGRFMVFVRHSLGVLSKACNIEHCRSYESTVQQD